MSARAPRADAIRNRGRILAAARDAFAQDGVEVPLDAIAAAAGVGPGTVHRNFPTKEALLTAVIADRLDELAERAGQLHGNPADDFFVFLTGLVDSGRDNLALSAALNGSIGTQIEGSAERLSAALQTLLEAAQRSGGVRQDVNVSDVHAIITGVLATENRLFDSRRGLGLEIAIDGLRTTTDNQSRLPRGMTQPRPLSVNNLMASNN